MHTILERIYNVDVSCGNFSNHIYFNCHYDLLYNKFRIKILKTINFNIFFDGYFEDKLIINS